MLLLSAAVLFAFPSVVAACGSFNNSTVVGQSNGFKVYAGLINIRGMTTGNNLEAYQGFNSGGLDNCVSACLGESHCMAITFRPQGSSTCLKFATINFVTQEPMRPSLDRNWPNFKSAVLRWNDGLCR